MECCPRKLKRKQSEVVRINDNEYCVFYRAYLVIAVGMWWS